jgi:2-iminoacetate synthase ThiH
MPPLEERLRIPFYHEGALVVFTEKTHLERGSCCGSNCRHCPFQPKAREGNTVQSPEVKALATSPV